MSSAVPVAPVPLSRSEAAAMAQRQLKKHDVAIVLLHWFNAVTWMLEVATGVALVSSRLFRVVPGWYIALVSDVFGTRANLLRFHLALGITWTLVLVPYVIFGFRTYVRAETLDPTDADDVRWLVVRARMILGRTTEPLPPQGIYNSGQKAFALVVWLMTPLVVVSGFIMAFSWISSEIVGWAVVVHFLAVGSVVAGLAVHVYMGAVFPEERPAFFSMITGRVNELFAYRHHFKWWREVKLAEQARSESSPAPGGDVPGVSPGPEAPR